MKRAKSVGAIAGGYDAIRTGSLLTAEISAIVKRLGSESVYSALTSDEKMQDFAREVYSGLSVSLRSKVSLDHLTREILSNKERLLKKKKNQKLIKNKIQ